MTDRVFNVLFLCTHNSARSVMADCILNRIGRGRFRAFSAGSLPSGQINPQVKALLERLGYPLADARSKSWDEFAAAEGTAAEKTTVTAAVYGQIERRLRAFAALPLDTLDRMAIKRRLSAMADGHADQAPESAQ